MRFGGALAGALMGPWWRLWWDSGGGRGGGRGRAKGRSCAPKAAPLRAGITDHAWCSLSDLSEAVARAHAVGTSRASLLSGGVNAKGTKSCPYEALPYGTRPVSPGEPPGGGCPESRGHGMRAAGAGPPLGLHAQGPARGRQRPLGSRSQERHQHHPGGGRPGEVGSSLRAPDQGRPPLSAAP